MMRQVILDTETTGLDWRQGHCIVEIGAVELLDRQLTGQQFHTYLKPSHDFDEESRKITGLTNEMLADKPSFSEVVDEFLNFIQGAELLIHNAPFDLGFINAELRRLKSHYGQVLDYATVQDTLELAQAKYPGQRNSLDALCKRLGINLAQRTVHGALLDAQLLAKVYIALTSGQDELGLGLSAAAQGAVDIPAYAGAIHEQGQQRPIVRPSEAEQMAHAAFIETLRQTSGQALWDQSVQGEDVLG